MVTDNKNEIAASVDDQSQSVVVIARHNLKKFLEEINSSAREKTVTKRQLLRALDVALGYGFIEKDFQLLSNNEKVLAPAIRQAAESFMILMADQYDNEKKKQDNKEASASEKQGE